MIKFKSRWSNGRNLLVEDKIYSYQKFGWLYSEKIELIDKLWF